jgi:hypothetical protein
MERIIEQAEMTVLKRIDLQTECRKPTQKARMLNRSIVQHTIDLMSHEQRQTILILDDSLLCAFLHYKSREVQRFLRKNTPSCDIIQQIYPKLFRDCRQKRELHLNRLKEAKRPLYDAARLLVVHSIPFMLHKYICGRRGWNTEVSSEQAWPLRFCEKGLKFSLATDSTFPSTRRRLRPLRFQQASLGRGMLGMRIGKVYFGVFLTELQRIYKNHVYVTDGLQMLPCALQGLILEYCL